MEDGIVLPSAASIFTPLSSVDMLVEKRCSTDLKNPVNKIEKRLRFIFSTHDSTAENAIEFVE